MRFDHAVIAVRDLAVAGERFAAAGFTVRPGGRHVGFGTENAIVRFGLDYIELIAVRDETEARRASPRSRALADFVRRHEAGFVGYALAPLDLDHIAERLRAAGQDVEGPTPMRRARPDGVVLEWTLLIPGGVAWRRPWPFFISWALPDAERLALEPPGSHAVGATAVSGISVAVDDLARARVLYNAMIGEPTATSATSLAFAVGDVRLDVVGPGDPVFPGLERGPGPFGLRLRAEPGVAAATREVLPSVTLTIE